MAIESQQIQDGNQDHTAATQAEGFILHQRPDGSRSVNFVAVQRGRYKHRWPVFFRTLHVDWNANGHSGIALTDRQFNRPLLAPHRDARAEDLLVAVAMIEEIWQGQRIVAVLPNESVSAGRNAVQSR